MTPKKQPKKKHGAQDITVINLRATKKLLARELKKRDERLNLLENNIRMLRKRIERLA